MPSIPQFSLRWNNYLQHITYAFDSLRSQEDLVDVTLCCEGRKIRAHKMLLSACSTYFKEIFKENPCQHPVIVFKNVKYDDLLALIEFMYQGEVHVQQESLPSFLNTAEMLSIQGLTEGNPMDGSVVETLTADEVTEIINKQDNPATTTTTTIPIILTATSGTTSAESIEIPTETITIATTLPQTQMQQQQQQQPPQILNKKYVTTPLAQQPQDQQQQLQQQQQQLQQQQQQQQQQQSQQSPQQQNESGLKRRRRDTLSDVEIVVKNQGMVQDQYDTGSETEYLKMEMPEYIEVTTNTKQDNYGSSDECKIDQPKQIVGIDAEIDPTLMQTDIECVLCARLFTSAAALKRHNESKHARSFVSYTCGQCGKKFKTKWSLSTHTSRFHRKKSYTTLLKLE